MCPQSNATGALSSEFSSLSPFASPCRLQHSPLRDGDALTGEFCGADSASLCSVTERLVPRFSSRSYCCNLVSVLRSRFRVQRPPRGLCSFHTHRILTPYTRQIENSLAHDTRDSRRKSRREPSGEGSEPRPRVPAWPHTSQHTRQLSISLQSKWATHSKVTGWHGAVYYGRETTWNGGCRAFCVLVPPIQMAWQR